MNTLKNYVIVGNICQLQIQDAGLNSVLGNRGTNNYRKICIKKTITEKGILWICCMVYVIHPQIEEPKIAHCECKVMPPVLIRLSDSVWLFFSAFFWGQIPALKSLFLYRLLEFQREAGTSKYVIATC